MGKRNYMPYLQAFLAAGVITWILWFVSSLVLIQLAQSIAMSIGLNGVQTYYFQLVTLLVPELIIAFFAFKWAVDVFILKGRRA